MAKDQDKIKILSDNLFPVVGVGASAGGLDAFRILVRSIPVDSGMAYILVQHLHPDHNSSLPEILQRETQIPVQEITDNIHVKSDHIYIIPSNKILVATDGILQLSNRPRNEKHMPIDIFLSSLAEVHQSHGIGVVLSGTGMDGTIGLKNIKDHGGVTFAQEPATASYDAMPASAINAGVVDFILPPEKIPEQLLSLGKTFKTFLGDPENKNEVSEEDVFKQILALLRKRKDVDFTYYKETTIRRRILRRLVINKIENLSQYLERLRQNQEEQDILFQDLLIPVTSFFRDHKSFDILCESVFPELLKDKSAANPLRIWVAGCSTGEEAYSIGMCLHEFLGDKIYNIKIQIFATDLSAKAITKARSGIYAKKEIEGVSESRLQHFFTKIDGTYQLKKPVRDMFIFAHHNFLKDPPFAKLDLITCRNVLIYFEPFLQKKAFTTFHYALRDRGFLMLGKSETVGSASELFIPFGKKEKFYTRKDAPGRFTAVTERILTANVEKDIPASGKKDDYQKNADDILLSNYTPSGVIVNEQHDIVQFRGSTSEFLEPSPGKASLNILKMAKYGLSFEIRNALHKAQTSKESFIKSGIPINKGENLVTIEVIPLINSIEPHFLILFRAVSKTEKVADKKSKKKTKQNGKSPETARITQLEKDLAQAREDMRTITEEQEAANEELQSANEELLSSAEELQSLNEELETSKEEIQSSNEELMTVNQELFERNEQFNQARLYAEAIISTIHEPLLVLHDDFKIRTANVSFFKTFQLTEDEIYGKNLLEIQDNAWSTSTLRDRLDKLKKDKKNFIEWEEKHQFSGIGERTLCINAQPIKWNNGETLILLAIDDITIRKEAHQKIQDFSHQLEMQVLERTASLKKLNLDLEHSNKNLEQFASIASHDLQEPLRKIQVFAALINKRHSEDTSPDTRELLGKIVIASERMSTLIKDVLNFSRISNPEIAFRKTDLNTILSNVIKDFDLLISEKNAVIHKENLPVIDAVPLQINQLFYNLLNNSLKFSKSGITPEISISSRILNNEEFGKYPELNSDIIHCEIEFRDNGIGFDQEYAEQVFLIFHRLHTQSQYSGTGIGLALCQKIVTLHHGEIHLKSKENEGTTFYIILPVQQSNKIKP